jgi:hypothetical protein
MADRFLIDGEWYGLGNDGEYYRLYPIKGTPTPGYVTTVNDDGVLEFTVAGASFPEALVDDATGELLFDDDTGDLLYDG